MAFSDGNDPSSAAPAPRVSVVMAVYNCRPYLEAAVQSILSQTEPDFEFIIIDDGSTDGTGDDLRRLAATDQRLKVTHAANKGLTKSLNDGLAAARGAYVARMDGDDIALPERLARQADALDADEGLAIVGGGVQLLSEDGLTLGDRAQGVGHTEIRRLLLEGDAGAMTHPAVMFRRAAAMAIGGFNEAFPVGQDLDFFLRVTEVGRAMNLPDTVLRWRQHDKSVNGKNFAIWNDIKRRAIRDTIERVGVERYLDELFTRDYSPVALGDMAKGDRAYRGGYKRDARAFWMRELRTGKNTLQVLKRFAKSYF
jgi:glycosyltransferase involved in cell wall biosynthesis